MGERNGISDISAPVHYLRSSGFFTNISYRKYYKNDHIFAVKYKTSLTLYLK